MQQLAAFTQTEETAQTTERDILLFSAVLLCFALALSFATLLVYPEIHPDEAWYANLAQNWIQTGNPWTTIDVGPFSNGRGQSTTLLGAVPSRIAIQLWGLHFDSVRLMSFFAGIAVVLSVVMVGAQLWRPAVGMMAGVVLALNQLFLAGSHINRPEIWVALVVLLALGASIRGWQTDRMLWDAFAAFLALLAVEIHQNGAIFAVALAATYVTRYGRDVWRTRNVWAFGMVSAIGGILYTGRQLGWSLSGAGGMSYLGTGSSHNIPLISETPLVWMFREISRYLRFISDDQLGALLIILALFVAIRRASDADHLLLTWLGASALAMMLLVSRRLELYLLPATCVATILVGRGLVALLQQRTWWVRSTVFTALTVLLVPTFLMAVRAIGHDPLYVQNSVHDVVGCRRILAPNQYWFGFTECDFRSFDQVSHYHHRQNLSLREALAAIKPAYIVVDATVDAKLQQGFGAGGDMGSYYMLPESEFRRFLDEQTTLERLISTEAYGTVRVYRVHWNEG